MSVNREQFIQTYYLPDKGRYETWMKLSHGRTECEAEFNAETNLRRYGKELKEEFRYRG